MNWHLCHRSSRREEALPWPRAIKEIVAKNRSEPPYVGCYNETGYSRTSQHGFTLVEVMLALAVSAIVLAAIGGIFFSAARLRERTTAMLDEAAPMQQALAILRRDLRGALPPGGGTLPLAGDFRSEALSGGTAQSDRLTLYTTSGSQNSSASWSDIQEVVYELKDPVQKTVAPGRDLIRSVYHNLLGTTVPEPDEQFLVGNVQSLEFTCYDGVDWRESWDTSLSETNLPAAVRVRIKPAVESASSAVSVEPFELIVPLVAQSRTNQLTAATSGGAQ
jgi:type II secretion system protein J